MIVGLHVTGASLNEVKAKGRSGGPAAGIAPPPRASQHRFTHQAVSRSDSSDSLSKVFDVHAKHHRQNHASERLHYPTGKPEGDH